MKLIGRGIKQHHSEDMFPVFKPRFPWLGGDLQTLRNSFYGGKKNISPDERLLAPIDVGAISIAVNYPSANAAINRNLVLVHGLGGDEDSSYMVSATRFFLTAGYTVFRMNYRGVGPSAEHSEAPYSAGLTSDLRAVIRRVIRNTSDAPVFIMGFSLGGQVILRTLGEGDVPENVAACVSVSAPLNLATAQQKLERRRNKPYARYVVGNMRRDMQNLQHPKVHVDPNTLTRIWDFDEHVIAPVFGFKNAADYYKRVSCYDVLAHITIPTLAIHAADDPWIPVEDYYAAQWPHDVPAGAIITPSGGHVGFHHKNAKHNPWHEEVGERFFNAYVR